MDDYQEYLRGEKDTFETNYVRDQYKNFLDSVKKNLKIHLVKNINFKLLRT